ncbi:VanZ family protein [Brachybacterium massiliense]|uniref:VanZ family protein n=1 Tax=Brachybacterium massiliense TaxID=1755098 RepID=UPI001482D55E|nr:VanZ family protein [Brachybacterium massiliense]
MPLPRGARGALLAMLAVLAAAGFLLLTSEHGETISTVNRFLWWSLFGRNPMQHVITPDGFGFLANIMLFAAPFLLLAIFRPRWWWVPVGVALSAVAELHQFSIATRHPDLHDVVANSLGALIGVAAGIAVRWGWTMLVRSSPFLVQAGVTAHPSAPLVTPPTADDVHQPAAPSPFPLRERHPGMRRAAPPPLTDGPIRRTTHAGP